MTEVAAANAGHAWQPMQSPSGLLLAGESHKHRIASFHHLSSAIFGHLDQDLVHEVLRRNPSQRTIQHALLALSVQLEAFACNHHSREVDHKSSIYTLNHYGKSLKGVQISLNNKMDINGHIETLLALSLIISYEILRGNGPAALAHLHGAMYLLSTSITTPGLNHENLRILEAIRILYLRLDVSALAFAGALGPTISTSSFDRISCCAENEVMKLGLPSVQAFQAIRTQFLCLKFRILQALRYNEAEDPSSQPCERGFVQGEQNYSTALMVELQRWFMFFQPALLAAKQIRQIKNATNSQMSDECLLLHMHYLILDMRLSCFYPEPRETAFDYFEGSFDTIIRYAETLIRERQRHLLFTLDMGLIEPLYLTVLKCREPNKRISALRLLQSCRQEAAWDGPLMTSIARRAIRMEAALTRTDGPEELLPDIPTDYLFDTAKIVWDFRGDPKAEHCRVSAVALPSIDWERRRAFTEFYHRLGRLSANCRLSMA